MKPQYILEVVSQWGGNSASAVCFYSSRSTMGQLKTRTGWRGRERDKLCNISGNPLVVQNRLGEEGIVSVTLSLPLNPYGPFDRLTFWCDLK